MKKITGIFFTICLLGLSLTSCGGTEKFKETKELDGQERDEVNAMQGALFTDGKEVYMEWGDIFRINIEERKIEPNCGDFLCNHDSGDCTARLLGGSYTSVLRNGDHAYITGPHVYEISKNSKKEVGKGGYGKEGWRLLFGDYIAYYEKEGVLVVEELDSGREVQRFEDVSWFQQGSFYYKGCIYYITDEKGFERLDLASGEREMLEKKGVTRASVYEDMIYYISGVQDNNWLVKMDPETLEKQDIAENAYYYNMVGDTLYYSTFPEPGLYCSDLNGKNQKELYTGEEYDWSFIWAFPQQDALILTGGRIEMDELYGEESYVDELYVFDLKSGEIDLENPMPLPNLSDYTGGEQETHLFD